MVYTQGRKGILRDCGFYLLVVVFERWFGNPILHWFIFGAFLQHNKRPKCRLFYDILVMWMDLAQNGGRFWSQLHLSQYQVHFSAFTKQQQVGSPTEVKLTKEKGETRPRHNNVLENETPILSPLEKPRSLRQIPSQGNRLRKAKDLWTCYMERTNSKHKSRALQDLRNILPRYKADIIAL